MGDQGSEWAAFIKDELKHEYAREEALNTRGASRLTAATGIVTISFASFTLLKTTSIEVTGAALVSVVVGLITLALAAILATLVGVAWKTHKVTTTGSMNEMLTTKWRSSETSARNGAAYANVHTINTLRLGNNIKYQLLMLATISQTAGILEFVFGAIVVLNR